MTAHPTEHVFSGPLRQLAGTLPFLLTLSLAVLANLPVSFTGRLLPAPSLALASVYFWVLVRPDLMPPALVLVSGTMEDIFSGGPPGLWSCGFLAAYLLADRQRDTLAGLGGIGALLGFAGAMLTAAATAFAVLLAVYWRAEPLAPLLLQCAVSVLFYPAIALAMGAVLRGATGPMRHGD